MSFENLLRFGLSIPLALLLAPAPAQAPPGWIAVTSLRDPSGVRPGPGGLWFIHPRDATAPVIQVANVPSELTGASHPSSIAGANCVTWRRDGALVVGEHGPAGATIGLHVLQLGGSPLQVTSSLRYPLGTQASPFGGGVVAAATLPNQDVLFAKFGFGGPLLAGTPLGTLQLGTGAITPVSVQFPPGFSPGLNALAVDSAGTVAYVANHLGGASMDIYRVPFGTVPLGTAMLTATWIARVPTLVTGMALDPTDTLLTMVGALGTNNVIQIDVTNGRTIASCRGAAPNNGLAMEDHTGAYLALIGVGAGYEARLMTSPCGALAPLAPAPPGGWGVPSGLVEIPSLQPFGAATVHANEYRWLLRPNPGGLPLAGNQAFGLAVEGAPIATPGIWGLTLAAQSQPLPILGVNLWLDPTGPSAIGVLAPQGNQASLSLPIPPGPSLRGLHLFFQTFHATGLGPTPLDASPGLRATIL